MFYSNIEYKVCYVDPSKTTNGGGATYIKVNDTIIGVAGGGGVFDYVIAGGG